MRTIGEQLAMAGTVSGQLDLTGDARHRHIPGSPYDWRHEWIPLNEQAAKSHFRGHIPAGWHAPGTPEYVHHKVLPKYADRLDELKGNADRLAVAASKDGSATSRKAAYDAQDKYQRAFRSAVEKARAERTPGGSSTRGDGKVTRPAKTARPKPLRLKEGEERVRDQGTHEGVTWRDVDRRPPGVLSPVHSIQLEYGGQTKSMMARGKTPQEEAAEFKAYVDAIPGKAAAEEQRRQAAVGEAAHQMIAKDRYREKINPLGHTEVLDAYKAAHGREAPASMSRRWAYDGVTEAEHNSGWYQAALQRKADRGQLRPGQTRPGALAGAQSETFSHPDAEKAYRDAYVSIGRGGSYASARHTLARADALEAGRGVPEGTGSRAKIARADAQFRDAQANVRKAGGREALQDKIQQGVRARKQREAAEAAEREAAAQAESARVDAAAAQRFQIATGQRAQAAAQLAADLNHEGGFAGNAGRFTQTAADHLAAGRQQEALAELRRATKDLGVHNRRMKTASGRAMALRLSELSDSVSAEIARQEDPARKARARDAQIAQARRMHDNDKSGLPGLVRVSGDARGMTAIDHEGNEHQISLKDGTVSVTRDGRTLSAPAGDDPTMTARRLAGQLAQPEPSTISGQLAARPAVAPDRAAAKITRLTKKRDDTQAEYERANAAYQDALRRATGPGGSFNPRSPEAEAAERLRQPMLDAKAKAAEARMTLMGEHLKQARATA